MPSHGAVKAKLTFKTDFVSDSVSLSKYGRCREREPLNHAPKYKLSYTAFGF